MSSRRIKMKIQAAALQLDKNEGINAYARISNRGVPHIVINEIEASVCYFGRSKTWRVFEPYTGQSDQTKTDFETIDEVEEYLLNKRVPWPTA